MDDERLAGRFHAARGMCELFAGQLTESLEATGRAAALCLRAGDAEGAGDAYSFLAWASVFRGDFAQALSYKEPAMRCLGRDFSARCAVYVFGASARGWAGLGRWSEAIADSHDGLRVAEQVADDGLITFAAHIASGSYLFQGDCARPCVPLMLVKHHSLWRDRGSDSANDV